MKLDDGFMDVFLEAMVTGDSGKAIENSEVRGQQSLVHSDTLPVDINAEDKGILEAKGVVFGDRVDDLFQQVTLPEGWAKKATGHSMWSKLVDSKGREIASIFYKAAFYDRCAFLHVEQSIREDKS
jgi:hypothetical protein